MKAVGIKILKNKLSEYVRLAAAGETVLVTDRDRVVAQITAPGAATSPLVADAILADAVRQGWLTPPIIHDPEPPFAPDRITTLGDLLKELDEDRSER
jgi:antitoxin (DNA-binding transcriptional repressor) of toxin-antitoxin stability system